MARSQRKAEYRVGVVGYGGAFNMGKCHLDSLTKNPGFSVAAVCDPDAKRRAQAAADYPGVATYASVDELLRKGRVDLVIVITPHNTHADICIRCLKAGKHVVCEKPLAITGPEALAMLKAAKAAGVMLSTFHNRRWDGDFVTLRRLIREGWIGPVFRIEAGFSGYGPQNPNWWRSDEKISGGTIYDWGAHFTDWILDLVDSPIEHVAGMERKNPAWAKLYTNVDHSESTVRFKNGCVSTLTISNLSMEPKPRWRVVGESGSVTDFGRQGEFLVKTRVKDKNCETTFKFENSNWDGYYANVAQHLVHGKPLVITAESAARVIGVLHASVLSARKGGAPVKPILP